MQNSQIHYLRMQELSKYLFYIRFNLLFLLFILIIIKMNVCKYYNKMYIIEIIQYC